MATRTISRTNSTMELVVLRARPKVMVKESQEKGGKGKGGKGKGFGSEIGVLDSHFGWQGTPLGHIQSDWSFYPNMVPICSLSTSLPVEASERAKELHHREQPVATFVEKAPKAWTRPVSISNRFHVLSAHDDDAYFPELRSDTCTDRPRMPPMPKRLPQQVRKKRFLCPLEKNTQSETDFINKAKEASSDAHQVKMLTSDRPILSTSSRHHTPCQPSPGWQLLSLTVDSGASETVIPHDQIRGYEIRESSSPEGMNFVSASEDPISNLGEQVLPFHH